MVICRRQRYDKTESQASVMERMTLDVQAHSWWQEEFAMLGVSRGKSDSPNSVDVKGGESRRSLRACSCPRKQ